MEIKNKSVCAHAQLRLTLQPYELQPCMLLCPWDSPGQNTRVGCHFLLQGIFLTQESNLSLLHWQSDSLPLNHQGSLDYYIPNSLYLLLSPTTILPLTASLSPW